MIVNQLEIISAETTGCSEGRGTVCITWKVNDRMLAGYTGSYTAVFFKDEEQCISSEFTDPMGMQTAELAFENFSYGSEYSLAIKVPEEQGGAESSRVKVYIDSFENIAGSFDGENLELTWEMTSNLWLTGRCKIEYSTGAVDIYSVNASNRRICLKPVKPAPGETMEVSLCVFDSAGSSGTASEPLCFYTSGMALCSCEITEKTEGKELLIKAKSAYTEQNSARLYIINRGTMIWSCDLQLEAEEKGSYSCKALVPQQAVAASVLSGCQIRLAALEGQAETGIPEAGDTLELQIPRLQVLDVDGHGIVCCVEMPETQIIPCCFAVKDENETKLVGYSEFVWELSEELLHRQHGASAMCGHGTAAQLSVSAVYRQGTAEQHGPSSGEIQLPAAGYYPYKKEEGGMELLYVPETPEEGVNSAAVSGRITGALADTVENEQIQLQKTETGFVLKVGTSAVCQTSDLEDFLQKLELTGKIPAYGIYELRDMILRLANISVDETSALLCGWKPENRWADLCPGMGLKITTSSYMHLESSSAGAAAGFVQSSDTCCPVIMRKEGDYLEFDCFAGETGKYMGNSSAYTAVNSPVIVSGMADFLQANIRQPYYSILFPYSLRSPELPESTCASDNYVLLAAGSRQAMQDAADAIAANPAAINTLNIPVIIFRGRSSLSLCIRIMVQETPVFVPVGTVVGDVMQMWGIHSAAGIRLYRRNAEGEKKEVYLKLTDEAEDIVLITGDCICLR